MRAELAEPVAAVLGPPAVAGAAELRIVGMRVVEQRAAGAPPVVGERENNAEAVIGGRYALSRHGSPPPAPYSPRRYRRVPSGGERQSFQPAHRGIARSPGAAFPPADRAAVDSEHHGKTSLYPTKLLAQPSNLRSGHRDALRTQGRWLVHLPPIDKARGERLGSPLVHRVTKGLVTTKRRSPSAASAPCSARCWRASHLPRSRSAFPRSA